MSEADSLEEKAIQDAERLLQDAEEPKKEESTTTEKPVETQAETILETAETKVEAEEEDITPHGEKSRLGRRVKRIEQESAKKLTAIEETLNLLKERILVTPQEKEEELELPENPTAEEIRDFVRKDRERLKKELSSEITAKETTAKEADAKYGREYAKMVEEMLDPEEDAEIYKLMTDLKDLTYNQVYKKDAKEDFLINYRNATKAILNKTKPGKVISLGKKASGVNVPNNTVVKGKAVDTSKWSVQEQQMAELLGDETLSEMGIS
jgi:hypothetical protein